MWAADSQHSHDTPPSNCHRAREGRIVSPSSGRYLVRSKASKEKYFIGTRYLDGSLSPITGQSGRHRQVTPLRPAWPRPAIKPRDRFLPAVPLHSRLDAAAPLSTRYLPSHTRRVYLIAAAAAAAVRANNLENWPIINVSICPTSVFGVGCQSHTHVR